MPSINNSDFKLTNNIDNQVWFMLIGSARLPYLGIGEDKVADGEKLMTHD